MTCVTGWLQARGRYPQCQGLLHVAVPHEGGAGGRLDEARPVPYRGQWAAHRHRAPDLPLRDLPLRSHARTAHGLEKCCLDALRSVYAASRCDRFYTCGLKWCRRVTLCSSCSVRCLADILTQTFFLYIFF